MIPRQLSVCQTHISPHNSTANDEAKEIFDLITVTLKACCRVECVILSLAVS